MRLFISIDIPEEIKNKIIQIQKKISASSPSIKPTSRDNLHITLKFLGEVHEDYVNKLVNIISETLKNTKPFTLSLKGIKYFGNPRFIKIIYIGLSRGLHETKDLMNSLNSSLKHIRKEEKEPIPHVTIFRVPFNASSESLLHTLSSLSDTEFGEFNVKEIKLKKSVLTPEGPVYSDIETFTVSS